MRKLLILWAALAGTYALAGQHDSITLVPANVASNETSVVTNAIPVTGKVLSYSAQSVGGSATVTVYTVSGRGSSLGAAKTIFPAAVVPPGGVVTNFAVAQYLAEDLIVVRADNSATTSSVAPRSVLIIER